MSAGTRQIGSVRAAAQFLPGVTVTAVRGETKITTFTDEAGRYTLDLAPGVWDIQVHAFGFTPVSQKITVGKEPLFKDWTVEMPRIAGAPAPGPPSHQTRNRGRGGGGWGGSAGDPITDIPLALQVDYFRVSALSYFVPVSVKIPGSVTALAAKGGASVTQFDFAGQIQDEQRNVVGNVRENITGKMGTFEARFTVPDLSAETTGLKLSSIILEQSARAAQNGGRRGGESHEKRNIGRSAD